MAAQLTADDARQSLTAHVEGKGAEALMKHGPFVGLAPLQALLADRSIVRYPCELVFDATPLMPGEFAHPVQKGAVPADGFTMYVHPCFAANPEFIAYAVLYQLVAVNYGEFASADEAEIFGATALGLTRDEYYDALCEFSDQLGGEAPEVPAGAGVGCGSDGGGGCGCGAE